MIDLILRHTDVIATILFLCCAATLVVLVRAGWRNTWRAAWLLALSLVPSILFFFVFTPLGLYIGESAYFVVALTFWGGLVGSAVLTMAGIVTKSAVAFVAAALFSLPAAGYLFLYPGGRWFVLVSILYLLGAALLYGYTQRKKTKLPVA